MNLTQRHEKRHILLPSCLRAFVPSCENKKARRDRRMRSFYRSAVADMEDEVNPRFVSLSHEEILFVENPHAWLPHLASLFLHEGTKARRHEVKDSCCRVFAAWVLAACLLFWSAFAQAQPPTREDLEPVLRTYQDGAAAHDFQKMKSAMADVAFATLHNMAVSFKKTFPPASSDDAFWQDFNRTLVPFGKLTFLTLKEKGEKAFLVYSFAYAWPSTKERKTQKGFIKANFILQKDGWKLLGCGMDISDSLTAKYEAGDQSFLNDPQLSQFEETPSISPLATPADYIAQIQWYKPKGKLVVTVNGIPIELTSMSGFQLVTGGLKKGENKIRWHYDPDAKLDPSAAQGPSDDLPKVRIHVFTGDKLKPDNDRQLLVYHWKPDANDHEETIRLNDNILAKLQKPEPEY